MKVEVKVSQILQLADFDYLRRLRPEDLEVADLNLGHVFHHMDFLNKPRSQNNNADQTKGAECA